ncbi:kinase STUNTED-like protein [Drosera capensis]
MMQTHISVGGDGGGGGEGRTVVVGVKLDSHSKELLTWSLVKASNPGDRVIAIHVLGSNEIVNREGKSTLLALVEAFDSILAVYEGFCNLKQVDLKLKICRGSSIWKILVREAKSYSATDLILGASSKHHTIRSSTSIAKYCAKKLSRDCSVIAVHNGKIVFHREVSVSACSLKVNISQGKNDQQSNSMQSILGQPFSDCKNVNSTSSMRNLATSKTTGLSLVKAHVSCTDNTWKQKCSICSPDSSSSCYSSVVQTKLLEYSNDHKNNSLAMVPIQNLEPASSPVSVLLKQLPEPRPGWPLLRRAIVSGRADLDPCTQRQTSVIQWAMQLPSRNLPMSPTSTCSNDQQGHDPSKVTVRSKSALQHSISSDKSNSLPPELEDLRVKFLPICRLFQYQELQVATSNFAPGNLIGKGGNSKVYRGCLPDGKELAVKILKNSEDVLRDFVLEIEIITSLRHKNIISLFGFCFGVDDLLLVYDFLPRGSLEENLRDGKRFGWTERYKVALGVADALHYLHYCSSHPVIHRDVKSSNILLSDDYEPELSDFGLANWASISSNKTDTDVKGTFGYLAPEYFMHGKVTDKIDVYAFGVVLLELLSGRKPISRDLPKGQESLVIWAKPILMSGKISLLLDTYLGSNYNRDEMERMVLAATLCIRRAPRARPQMSRVLKLLQGDDETLQWARLEVNASRSSDCLDEDSISTTSIQSHLNLALLDVDDDSLSIMSSVEQHVSLEDYLKGRWSRTPSFD